MRVTAERFTLERDGCRYKATLHYPENRFSRGAVLVSCPHPMLGGTADNPVVGAIVGGIVDAGGASVVWEYPAGEPEASATRREDFLENATRPEDVLRDLAHLYKVLDGIPGEIGTHAIGVAGYSYGALLSLMASGSRRPALVVSPPLRAIPPRYSVRSQTAMLLWGEKDFALCADDVAALESRAGASFLREQTLPGGDHFLLDELDAVRVFSRAWFAESQSLAPRPHASNLL